MKACTCKMRYVCVNGTGNCMSGSLLEDSVMDSSITANDVTKAKQVVLKSAMGLCSLNDADFFQRLEELYWTAFKDGFEKQRLIDIK